MSFCRRLIVVTLICFTGFASAFPRGVMPVLSENGITFVICSGSDLVTVRLLDNGDIVPDDSPGEHPVGAPDCAWAQHASTAALISPVVQIAAGHPDGKLAYRQGAQDLVVRAKLSHYDSRGPPFFL